MRTATGLLLAGALCIQGMGSLQVTASEADAGYPGSVSDSDTAGAPVDPGPEETVPEEIADPEPSADAEVMEIKEYDYQAEIEEALQEIIAEREIMALVYLSTEYEVKKEADMTSETVHVVPSGQTAFIEGFQWAADGKPWDYVRITDGNSVYHGYVERSHLAVSDERFLAWEKEYGTAGVKLPGMGNVRFRLYLAETPTVDYSDVEQFPASYQPALRALKEQHPNWIFVPMNTGLDWNTVIANEIVGGKSLVHKSFPAYTKQGAYDGGNWFYASEDILKLYMDPRNALQENAIFQFEQLTYNATYHTQAAVEAFLNNTFMNSGQPAPGTDLTYAQIIWYIGAEEGRSVSPVHLASRIYQEQGNGTSPLISGTYPGFEGYYNHFNVGATGTSNEQVIVNGLTYAKNQGWNNAYYSILGGADVISQNYIRKGQDTLYLQKFNVNPQGSYKLYSHQYMQNISAPTTEAKSIRNLYQKANSLDNTFVFKIPVFENMPETPCPYPESCTDVVLQIPAGYDTTVYLDGIPHGSVSRNGRYIVKTIHPGYTSAVVYRYNENGVPVGMYVWTLSYANGMYTATEHPDLTDLLTYHGFSIRITGKPGIRFKTGIPVETRNLLLTTGIDGYKLKEYGTLVMNQTNMSQYPMVKGGQKVLDGLSYGINADGVLEDKIYETVNDRYRYTSVLVGQPASQYRTEYAFRGYIILEKDGVPVTFYGPPVGRSIYFLANQVLNAGSYPVGSDADQFLRQLIADSDALQTHQ